MVRSFANTDRQTWRPLRMSIQQQYYAMICFVCACIFLVRVTCPRGDVTPPIWNPKPGTAAHILSG
jgi:hypothetical protein